MALMLDIIERVKADIREGKRGRMGEIAKGSGVKRKTLSNLYYGVTKATNLRNAQKLADYYAQFERRSGTDRRRAA